MHFKVYNMGGKLYKTSFVFTVFHKPFFPIENKSNVKLYLIKGGLGQMKRVFKYLKLNVNTKIIKWIDPEPF